MAMAGGRSGDVGQGRGQVGRVGRSGGPVGSGVVDWPSQLTLTFMILNLYLSVS